MNDLFNHVVIHILAHWLSLIIMSSFAAIIIIYITTSRRYKLFMFFGLTELMDKPKLNVYLSNIRVQRGGSLFSDDTIAVNFESSTVSAGEFLEIATLDNLFDSGILKYIPPFLREKLTQINIAFSDIRPLYKACPVNISEIIGNNIILIGGPDFNAASRYFMGKEESYMSYMSKEERSKPFVVLRRDGDIIKPISVGSDLAIVERIRVDDKVIFIVAGNGTNGTRAAIRYLSFYWNRLHEQFQKGNFAICIQCEEREINPKGFENMTVLKVIPEIMNLTKTDRILKTIRKIVNRCTVN